MGCSGFANRHSSRNCVPARARRCPPPGAVAHLPPVGGFGAKGEMQLNDPPTVRPQPVTGVDFATKVLSSCATNDSGCDDTPCAVWDGQAVERMSLFGRRIFIQCTGCCHPTTAANRFDSWPMCRTSGVSAQSRNSSVWASSKGPRAFDSQRIPSNQRDPGDERVRGGWRKPQKGRSEGCVKRNGGSGFYRFDTNTCSWELAVKSFNAYLATLWRSRKK